jgi:benzylsuccinate CoA-transferase BbsE subunit
MEPMLELHPPSYGAPDAPLAGLLVVELAGELTGYAGRLLNDLGADVVLVGTVDDSPESRFLHHGKRVVADADELAVSADVLLYTGGADGVQAPPVGARTIAVLFTPFGTTGPAADWASTDLIRLASGGLLWLGGYPEVGPIAPYGNQSALAVSTYGVVAILLALFERDAGGDGCTLEISAQEVITQALETALPDYELTGRVRTRLGPEPPEAGSGIYPCKDGYISMIAGRIGTADAWQRLREWLVEAGEPGANDLWEAPWETLEYRQRADARARFGEIFRSFASTRTKQELYEEAQRRSIALAPVNTPAEVIADPQLVARSFMADADGYLVPSPPYRFSPLAPAEMEEAPAALEVA